MKHNMGTRDRSLRILLGIVLLGLMFSDAMALTDTIGRWGWVGVIPLVTGLIGWCPLYLPWHIDTRNREPQQAEEG